MAGRFGFGEDMSDRWTAEALDRYEAGWEAFVARTMTVDMSEVRGRFLRHVPEGGCVLDLGAGAGRDVAAFLRAGYDVTALEPCRALADHVRSTCGVEVLGIPAGDLDAEGAYDGIWACASLLHLDRPGLDDAVARVAAALRPRGALYVSFKDGDGHRFDDAGRHFLDLTLEDLAGLCVDHGMKVVERWHSDPVIADQAGCRWCNVVARRDGRS